MNYSRFLASRLAQLIPTVLGLSVVIFILTRALPGDPARLALGPLATQEQVEQLRHLWGLDQPLYVQYFRFISGVFQGSFGVSLASRRDVVLDIQQFLPATIELATAATLFSVLVGIPLGVVSAKNKDKWPDHISRVVSLGGVSFPDFWIAIMLLVFFGSFLKILPIGGELSVNLTPPPRITGSVIVDSLLSGKFNDFFDAISHLLLPAFVLSLPMIANISRVTRSMMIEQFQKDYVLLEFASGLPRSLILYKYMLKNAFAPTLTLIALQYSYAFGGAVVVEYVFSWPGIGQYLAYAILNKDVNAISGVTLVVGSVIALTNLVTELLYGWLDPRTRFRQVL
jgi:peptide/nickel transport system permease protein